MNPAFLEMTFDLPLPKQKIWIAAINKGIWSKPPEEQERLLRDTLKDTDLAPFREKIVNNLMTAVRFEDVVPAAYADYKPIVSDGIRFFLGTFSLERLKTLCIQQLALPDQTEQGERLLKVVNEIPTLFKLGQIIARNQGTDPDLKTWLTRLEDGAVERRLDLVHSTIRASSAENGLSLHISPESPVLAAGSVAVVVPVTRSEPGALEKPPSEFLQGKKLVAKTLRPHIPQHLHEELQALDALADFFEKNRRNYHLKDFAFRETFREIRQALEKETNLRIEQENIRCARRDYQEAASLVIPEVLAESTSQVTIMERLNGKKITEATLSPQARLELAKTLYQSLILIPLFDHSSMTLFHGDPHAGNLLILNDDSPHGTIGVLDWSQADRLGHDNRRAILQMALGIFLEDRWRILQAVKTLIKRSSVRNAQCSEPLHDLVQKLLSGESRQTSILERVFWLVDELIIRGFVFPPELLLFRKATFTLSGVLNDLSPDFDMESEIFLFLRKILTRELPNRPLLRLFPPRYSTTLSTLDLHAILQKITLQACKHLWNWESRVVNQWLDLLAEASEMRAT